MSADSFAVAASSGSLSVPDGTRFPHQWTKAGVSVETEFTGAHLLHLSIAGCLLNDVYREARKLDTEIAGVKVTARGDFNRETWESTGIDYSIEIDSEAAPDDIDHLLDVVDRVAEIPKAVRSGGPVRRV